MCCADALDMCPPGVFGPRELGSEPTLFKLYIGPFVLGKEPNGSESAVRHVALLVQHAWLRLCLAVPVLGRGLSPAVRGVASGHPAGGLFYLMPGHSHVDAIACSLCAVVCVLHRPSVGV